MEKKSLISLEQFLLVIITSVAYFLTASLGLSLATINEQASPVWPAAGIAISLVYLYGNSMCTGVWLGAFLANSLLTGLDIMPSAFVALGNTLEAYLAVYLFRAIFSKSQPLGLHSTVVFSQVSLFIASALGAVVGTTTLFVFSVIPIEQVGVNWFTWWIGDTLGALYLVPFAYKISLKEFNLFPLKKGQIQKLFGLLVLTLVLTYIILIDGRAGSYIFSFLLVLFLAAIWFESSWVYIFSILICGIVLGCTILGYGPFTNSTVNNNLIHMQLFLASLGFIAIGLGSLKRDGFLSRPRYALIAGWLLSGLAFFSIFNLNRERDISRFQYEVKKAEAAIQMKLEDQIQILKAGASLFKASDSVSVREWKVYTQNFLKTSEASGMLGLGVIFSSPTTDEKEFLKIAGVSDMSETFRIRSVWNTSKEDSIKTPEINFIITFLEPLEKNREAIGLNIATEKKRFSAALKARDSGEAALSDQTQLVQDKKVRPGHILYYPLYKNKGGKDFKKLHKGFIFAPIIASQFFRAALSNISEVQLTAYLGDEIIEKNKLYQSDISNSSTWKSIVSHKNLAGQSVTFVWSPSSEFGSSSLTASWIGLTGTLCTLFLALMLSSLEGLTVRAQKIADNKTAEVVEQRRVWQALTETSPVGIFLTDEAGSCNYVNPAWCKLSGLSPEEAKGEGWIRAIHQEDLTQAIENWIRFLKGGDFNCSFRFLKKDKTSSYIMSLGVALKDEQGIIKGFIATAQDITELHYNQEALITSSRLSSLGEMASGVAHEINNPLAIIMSKANYIQDLLKAKQTDGVDKHVQQIISTVDRIARIIRGLQAFARETSDEAFQTFSLNDVIQNTLELCRERFFKHSTEIQLHIPEDVDFKFFGREEQISQVLMNLLSNGFDAVQTLDKKWVRIEVQKENDTLRLVVSDSGLSSNISESTEKSMFTPFFTTKEVGRGTGLGLSVSKGIIEKHNGRLFLDRKSQHTKFVVELKAV